MPLLRTTISFVFAALFWHCVAIAAEPLHTVPDNLAQRVQACTLCHGKEGRATPSGLPLTVFAGFEN